MNWEQLALAFADDLAAVLRRRFVLAMARGWEEGAGAVALELAFDLDNPRVQEVLGEIGALVRGMADTTIEDVRRLVGLQASEGWSMARLAEEIGRLSEDIAPNRARMIAVTETARAQSLGAMLAYQESGVVTGLSWLVSDPCPICAANRDAVVPLGEAFPSGHTAPPAHPACRCSISPRLD